MLQVRTAWEAQRGALNRAIMIFPPTISTLLESLRTFVGPQNDRKDTGSPLLPSLSCLPWIQSAKKTPACTPSPILSGSLMDQAIGC
jgi:hypothetical protein